MIFVVAFIFLERKEQGGEKYIIRSDQESKIGGLCDEVLDKEYQFVFFLCLIVTLLFRKH